MIIIMINFFGKLGSHYGKFQVTTQRLNVCMHYCNNHMHIILYVDHPYLTESMPPCNSEINGVHRAIIGRAFEMWKLLKYPHI